MHLLHLQFSSSVVLSGSSLLSPQSKLNFSSSLKKTTARQKFSLTLSKTDEADFGLEICQDLRAAERRHIKGPVGRRVPFCLGDNKALCTPAELAPKKFRGWTDEGWKTEQQQPFPLTQTCLSSRRRTFRSWPGPWWQDWATADWTPPLAPGPGIRPSVPLWVPVTAAVNSLVCHLSASLSAEAAPLLLLLICLPLKERKKGGRQQVAPHRCR